MIMGLLTMQGLPKILLCVALSSMMAGCVTERTYSGTNVPVEERSFDRNAAALERINLGLTYLRKGNSQQAKFNLNKAKDYAPNLEDVHIAFAYYYQVVGEVASAEKAYKKATEGRNASGDAFNNFGVFLCQQGKFEASEKNFLAAINTPQYTRVGSSYENLGICSRDAGQIEKARHYFEMALKYEPRRLSTLLELVELEIEQKDYALAREQLSRFHAISAQSPRSLALAIKIEQGLNDFIAAKRFGLLLLAKFPQSPQATQYRESLQ